MPESPMKLDEVAGPLRVLIVDDEPAVLRLLDGVLRSRFQVRMSNNPAEALKTLELDGPFAVVISDLSMPEMDGISFLSRARDIARDTVRILLTGNADLEAAIAATNDGQIFRFLEKPIQSSHFLRAVELAAEQHSLVTAERVLLEQTLRGSIRALTDILAAVSPDAFGRASRLNLKMMNLLDRLEISERWHIEVATMLCQIGIVTLPPPVAEKFNSGGSLSRLDQNMADRLPEVSAQLLSGIPRLESVREIILNQDRRFGGTEGVARQSSLDVPWGARALKILLDQDALESQGFDADEVGAVLRGRSGWYDPVILETVIGPCAGESSETEIREFSVAELRAGIVFAEDVLTLDGIKMVARGQEVTEGILLRLMNFARQVGIVEPIRGIVPIAGHRPGSTGAKTATG